MAKTTRIRNAAWIVAWDVATNSHGYLTGGDIVFPATPSPISASNTMVMWTKRSTAPI